MTRDLAPENSIIAPLVCQGYYLALLVWLPLDPPLVADIPPCLLSLYQVLFTLAMLCFMDSMYSLSVVSFLPEQMIAESPIHAAMIFSLYYIAVLLGNRATRIIGQQFGREILLGIGIACLFASSALSVMAMEGRVHLRIMLLARTIQGLGSAFIQTVSLGIVLDECQSLEESATENAFSTIVAANAFGAAMGPCVGGILYTLRGPTAVFLAFVVLIGVAGILCSFFVSFPDGPLPSVSFDSLLANPAILLTSAGFFIVYACLSLLWSTFPIHLSIAFGSKAAVVGLIFTLVLLSHDVFLPIIYSFLEVRSAENRATFVACAFFMMGFFTVLAYMAKRWYGMCGMLFLWSFSAALGMGCCSTELSERSTQNLANYHLKETACLLGASLGPLIGAFVSKEDPGSKSQQDLLVGYCILACMCFGYVPVYYRYVFNLDLPKDI